MPKFMKDAAISILDGAVETYIFALYGQSIPTIRTSHKPETKYAPIIGLLGTCAELIVKACLVQAKGLPSMYKNGDVSKGVYLNASDILDDLKREVKNNASCVSFLWKNPEENDDIRNRIVFHLDKFKLLFLMRGDGFHAGMGCSRDVCATQFSEVYEFICLLSQSKRLKAYLKNIPAPETPLRDREAIIEDLNRRLASAKDDKTKMGYLRNMYLVLPYIPEIEPEWVKALQHIIVATPSQDDLSYLVKTLSHARSIHLLKARGGKEGIPVRIDPTNDSSIPIAVQYLKRELITIPDNFQNDVLSANSRLKQNRLDLPVEDFIVDLYAAGIRNVNVLQQGQKLTAQNTWPYVASAISTQGTPRPCFFLIRECDELDKLVSILKSIVSFANGYYKRRVDTVIACINSMKNQIVMRYSSSKDEIYRGIRKFAKEPKFYGQDVFSPDFIRRNCLGEEANKVIQTFVSNEIEAGTALEKLLSVQEFGENEKKYAIKLLKACRSSKDKGGLVAILRSELMKQYISQARKTMFYIDIIEDGPNM